MSEKMHEERNWPFTHNRQTVGFKGNTKAKYKSLTAANSLTETHLSDLAARGRRISVGRPTGAF